MPVPTRVYVGVVVFGLITVLVTIPYTVLVLAGYRRAANASEPYQLLFPPEGAPLAAGEVLFLVLACVFSVILVWASWKALLRGARRDAQRRRAHAELKRELQNYARAPRPPKSNS